MGSFFRSRLNWTLLATLVAQIIALGMGKTEVSEATLTAVAGNVIGLGFRIHDAKQKAEATKK